MTLDALRCFCAIVETGGFRTAAQRVHRSQPAVSQQLKSLEQELGHLLVERKTGRITPIGQRLYAQATHILQDMETLKQEMADFDEEAGQELRIGTSDTTALYVLPNRVRHFAESMPKTRLVLTNRSSDDIASQVLQGDLELGIVTLPQQHPQLEVHPWFEQALALVLPARHPLARKRNLSLSMLREEPFLLMDTHTRTGMLLQEFFESHHFTPPIVLDSGSFEVIKRYISEGVGISFLPALAVSNTDTQLRTRPLAGLPRIPIGVIRRKDAYRSKAANAFLQFLALHEKTRSPQLRSESETTP